jgi:uncharacterized protein (DUF2249 family)/quercetin dioxygenase-like cupin family protein
MVNTDATAEPELDVRGLAKPLKHPAIFSTYDALAPGESFVLVNDHDPRHLHEEFEVEHPGSHGWTYLHNQPRDWRIRITKLASTPLPRILCDATAVAEGPGDPAGAAWKLPVRERDLDANIVRIPPGSGIDAHHGPDLDVLLLVLHGSGRLHTELDTVELRAGALAWLPRRSRRAFTAGDQGLAYLTVHQRRQVLPLTIGSGPRP